MNYDIAKYKTSTLYELTSPERGGFSQKLARLIQRKRNSAEDLLIHVRKCAREIEVEGENFNEDPLLSSTYQGLRQLEEFIILTERDVTLIREILKERLIQEARMVSGMLQSEVNPNSSELKMPFLLANFSTQHGVRLFGTVINSGTVIYDFKAPNLSVSETKVVYIFNSNISGEIDICSSAVELRGVKARTVKIGGNSMNLSISDCDVDELVVPMAYKILDNELPEIDEPTNLISFSTRKGKIKGIKKITIAD